MSPQWHPGSCKVCGGFPEEVGDISGTGLCREHAEERRQENLIQLAAHRGPYFDKWRAAMVAAFTITPSSDSQKAS